MCVGGKNWFQNPKSITSNIRLNAFLKSAILNMGKGTKILRHFCIICIFSPALRQLEFRIPFEYFIHNIGTRFEAEMSIFVVPEIAHKITQNFGLMMIWERDFFSCLLLK